MLMVETEKKNVLQIALIVLLFFSVWVIFLRNLFIFEVNISSLLDELNDYLIPSFGFYFLFFPKPVHMIIMKVI